MPFETVEGAGSAVIRKGDPRIPTKDIDAWYQGILTEVSEPRRRPYLYGADAGLCARRNVLLEHNSWIPSEGNPTGAAYMAIGVGLEDMLAQGLKNKGKLLVQGMRLVEMPELKISGKIDLIIQDHEDELALVEVKTCGELPVEPRPTHLAQIQTYAAVSGIHRCWLSYISRNVRDSFGTKLAVRSFRIDTSEEQLTNRLRIAALSETASKLHKLPPVPATFRKHTECHYCEFRDHFCWGTRIGLGGDEASSPLAELSTEEHIVLDSEATAKAEHLFDSSDLRRYQTLIQLSQLDLAPRLHQLVQSELNSVLSILAE